MYMYVYFLHSRKCIFSYLMEPSIFSTFIRTVCIYVLVITPLRGIWRVYTHDARGRVAPEGRGRIYQPNHEEGVL